MNTTDKVLDNLVARATVISEFCAKSSPKSLSKEDLDMKQHVLFLLQEDHNNFKHAAEKKVQADAVDDNDSTSKGIYGLLTAAQKTTGGRDNSSASALKLSKFFQKHRDNTNALSEDNLDIKHTAEKEVTANVVDDADSEIYGRYRLALSPEQKKRDRDVRSAIALCFMQGYEAKERDSIGDT